MLEESIRHGWLGIWIEFLCVYAQGMNLGRRYEGAILVFSYFILLAFNIVEENTQEKVLLHYVKSRNVIGLSLRTDTINLKCVL